MNSAPTLASCLQATLNTPDLRVLGVRHRARGYQPAVTVLDITTPDQQRPVAPALDYWNRLKNTHHMSGYALWGHYQTSTPARGNIISSLHLVRGKRVEVEWESNLTYVKVQRIPSRAITVLPPRALLVIPEAA